MRTTKYLKEVKSVRGHDFTVVHRFKSRGGTEHTDQKRHTCFRRISSEILHILLHFIIKVFKPLTGAQSDQTHTH